MTFRLEERNSILFYRNMDILEWSHLVVDLINVHKEILLNIIIFFFNSCDTDCPSRSFDRWSHKNKKVYLV